MARGEPFAMRTSAGAVGSVNGNGFSVTSKSSFRLWMLSNVVPRTTIA